MNASRKGKKWKSESEEHFERGGTGGVEGEETSSASEYFVVGSNADEYEGATIANI